MSTSTKQKHRKVSTKYVGEDTLVGFATHKEDGCGMILTDSEGVTTFIDAKTFEFAMRIYLEELYGEDVVIQTGSTIN